MDPSRLDAQRHAAAAPVPAEAGRTLVTVCTYNEAENLPELVDRVFAVLPQTDLLIVDDDSPDGSGRWALDQAAADRRIKVILRPGQRGLGGAIRCAMVFAVDQPYDFLLNLDGDLSHSPEILPAMLKLAREDPSVDVVVGSRYCPGGGVQGWPWRRKLMSRLVNRFATAVLRLPVSDCSGSLRCYRVPTLAAIDPASLQSQGYAVLEEVLLRLHRQGAKMVEVPITFNDRTRGTSKLTLAEALRSSRQLIRMAR